MGRKKRDEIQSSNVGSASRKGAVRLQQQHSPPNASVWVISVALALLTFSAYWGVRDSGFVNLDDDAYVEFAPMVNQGLRGAAVVWAFTAAHSNNWHPLTSLSHMLDCDLFGVHAGPMHMENVCWHAANAILLFLLFKRMTGSQWRSAFVAGLFALHPSHVESVARISERKDVLSTFFLLLALLAFVTYVKHKFKSDSKTQDSNSATRFGRFRSARFYLLSLGFFALALLSKPMVVTLPCLLLLLDFWPLGRMTQPSGKVVGPLVLEKLPFFGLALVVGVITLLVQFRTGAANYAARFSFSARVGNALVSCVRYLEKTFWPAKLSVFYHHPGSWPPWAVIAAGGIVLGISIMAWWQRRQRPWVGFGWLWFLISLLPVIGLIQVGSQAMADRYTYIPLIGIFIIVAWALPIGSRAPALNERAGDIRLLRSPALRRAGAIAAVIVLGLCLGVTRGQVRAWHDSISLYEHSIAAGEDNATVRYLLGSALQAAGAPEAEWLAQYRRALELDPTYVNALTQLAVNSLNHGDNEQSRKLIERTLELEPNNPALHKNLGAFYARTGRPEQAIPHFEAALKLDPNYGDAHHELAWINLQQNKLEPAIQELRAVVRANPWDAQARYELGDALARSGQTDEAKRELERAIWILPTYAQARERLAGIR
jgi:Flp pilus assembly protein TadD